MKKELILGLIATFGFLIFNYLYGFMSSLNNIVAFITAFLVGVVIIGVISSRYMGFESDLNNILLFGSIGFVSVLPVYYFANQWHIWITSLMLYSTIVGIAQIPVAIVTILSIIGSLLGIAISGILMAVQIAIFIIGLIEVLTAGMIDNFILRIVLGEKYGA